MSPRSAESTAREAIRARSARKYRGRLRDGDEALDATERAGQTCLTGHPAFMALAPVIELGRMPEGGGYPVGLIERACELMGVSNPASVLHLCSGSVRAPLSIDIRQSVGPACVGDVRRLPVRSCSVRHAMVDPPYDPDYAEALWGLGKRYPTPAVILRECERILVPGGTVAFLHHVLPVLPDGLERVGTYGVTTGVGYRIRALTIARKRPAGLFDA